MKSVSRFLKPGLGSRRPSISISKPGIVLSTLPSEHFKGSKAGLEEPQSVSAQQGYGYYPGRLGECIGDGEATFRIVRKLGWGSYPNVWLGQDTRRGNSFVALKILTANATRGCFTGQMDEQSFHLRIFNGREPTHRQNASTASHLPPIKHHPGIAHISRFLGSFPARSIHGDHICFIFEVLGPNMADIRTAFETPGLTLATVKAIVKQSLLALDYLHAKCGIIHCDIKPGNILLKTGTNSLSSRVMDLSTTSIITDAAQPPSQPLPVDPLDDPQVTIADFGHANWTDRQFHNQVGAMPMLPPEMLLRLPNAMTPAVDIWAFGCTESSCCFGFCPVSLTLPYRP